MRGRFGGARELRGDGVQRLIEIRDRLTPRVFSLIARSMGSLAGLPSEVLIHGGGRPRRGPCWAGAPGGTRTPDLRLRRPTLYPAELRAHSTRMLAHGITLPEQTERHVREKTKAVLTADERQRLSAQGGRGTRVAGPSRSWSRRRSTASISSSWARGASAPSSACGFGRVTQGVVRRAPCPGVSVQQPRSPGGAGAPGAPGAVRQRRATCQARLRRHPVEQTP